MRSQNNQQQGLHEYYISSACAIKSDSISLDTEFIYKTTQGAINIYNVATSSAVNVLAASYAVQLKLISYKLSPDRKYLLYSFDAKQVING